MPSGGRGGLFLAAPPGLLAPLGLPLGLWLFSGAAATADDGGGGALGTSSSIDARGGSGGGSEGVTSELARGSWLLGTGSGEVWEDLRIFPLLASSTRSSSSTRSIKSRCSTPRRCSSTFISRMDTPESSLRLNSEAPRRLGCISRGDRHMKNDEAWSTTSMLRSRTLTRPPRAQSLGTWRILGRGVVATILLTLEPWILLHLYLPTRYPK